MEEAERRIEAYRARGTASVRAKLHALLDLRRLQDPRVVPFLLEVLQDRCEAAEVRLDALKQLRNGDGLFGPADRLRVATAIGGLLSERSSLELQLQAVLALGEFTGIDGVLARLSAICVARDESIDLRYAAFTSLERAGPTPECITLLRQMSNDETFGPAARSVLAAWHVE